jgi:hypothetical protein
METVDFDKDNMHGSAGTHSNCPSNAIIRLRGGSNPNAASQLAQLETIRTSIKAEYKLISTRVLELMDDGLSESEKEIVELRAKRYQFVISVPASKSKFRRL